MHKHSHRLINVLQFVNSRGADFIQMSRVINKKASCCPTYQLASYFNCRSITDHGSCAGKNQDHNRSKLGQPNISGMRKPYKGKQDVFDVQDLVAKEPYWQFCAWFEEAKKTDGIMEANAMALATATKDGKPSVRMVLMKAIDKQGVVFYTNYGSQKAQELTGNPRASLLFYWSSNTQASTISRQTENPQCSLMFYWEPLMKMVRIEGSVERVSDAESTEYFHSRPRTSQIGACVSQQSQVIQSRKVLDDRNEEYLNKYSDESVPIPKPDYWGGFRVVPVRFEFWQGQTNRLHDRIIFRRPQEGEVINPDVTHRGTDGWVYERLMP